MDINYMDLRKTGVLFFDMLNAYYHAAPEDTKKRMQPVVASAVRLRDAARKFGIPIMYAKANHRPDGATTGKVITDTDMKLRPWPNNQCIPGVPAARAGSWEGEIIEELKPAPEDTIILKYRWSAFYQTYLDLALRTRGIDTVILSGCTTDIGIISTMYSARDMDYSFIMVRDACTGTSDQIHNTLMDKVFPRMARLRTTDQVLEMMQKGDH